MLPIKLDQKGEPMRTLGGILLSAVAILSIGCKGSDSSDSSRTSVTSNNVVIIENDGRCSQAMIDIHNDVIYKFNDAKDKTKYSSTVDISELKAACDKYKATINDHTCVANKDKTTERMTMSKTSLDDHCVVTEDTQGPDIIETPVPQDETPSGTTSQPTETVKYCSVQVGADLESFKEAVDLHASVPGISALKKIDLACSKLKTSLGSQPCLYGPEKISYETNFKALCDKTSALIQNPPSAPPTTGVDEDKSDLTDGSLILVLTPLQPKNLTELTKNSETAYFKAGVSVKSREELGKKGPYCLLERAMNLKLSLTTEVTLAQATFDSTSGLTILTDEGSNFILTCGHVEKSAPLKLAELKAVLNKWFKFKEIK
jgi:hypothetical protein